MTRLHCEGFAAKKRFRLFLRLAGLPILLMGLVANSDVLSPFANWFYEYLIGNRCCFQDVLPLARFGHTPQTTALLYAIALISSTIFSAGALLLGRQKIMSLGFFANEKLSKIAIYAAFALILSTNPHFATIEHSPDSLAYLVKSMLVSSQLAQTIGVSAIYIAFTGFKSVVIWSILVVYWRARCPR